MEAFFAGIGVAAVIVVWSFACMTVGWHVCADNIKKVLSGKRSVSDYWREHGLQRRAQ